MIKFNVSINKDSVDKFLSAYDRMIENIKKDIAERARNAARLADLDADKAYEKYYKEVFELAVDQFYDSYTPKDYRRNYSLYNVIHTEVTEDGSVFGYSPEKMTWMRNPTTIDNALFEQVFIRGWHGGADRIDSSKEMAWGVHPKTGTPYWRRHSVWYKTGKRGTRMVWNLVEYAEWGRPASVSKPSPYEVIDAALEKYESSVDPGVYRGFLGKRLSEAGIHTNLE